MEASPLAPPSLRRLPSGRHRLTREDVVASQRGRLLVAIAEAVAERGYAGTTVGDVVERAGVSRSTFYDLFPDKRACFLAAYDTGVEVLLGRLRDAGEALPRETDWRARAREEIETYVEVLSGEPAFAWSLHVEVLAAGPAALKRRAEIFALFAARTRRLHELARRQDSALAALPDGAFPLLVGGIDELVRERLRTRGAEALPELVEPAVAATLALFGDRTG